MHLLINFPDGFIKIKGDIITLVMKVCAVNRVKIITRKGEGITVRRETMNITGASLADGTRLTADLRRDFSNLDVTLQSGFIEQDDTLLRGNLIATMNGCSKARSNKLAVDLPEIL